MKNILYVFICTLLLVTACSQDSFTGNNPEKAYDKSVTVGCYNSPQQISVTGNKTTLAVDGQICLKSSDAIIQEQVNIMFIVDESGSMSSADGGVLSCGRRQAINAVVNKIKSDAQGANVGDSIKLGTIKFASSASGGNLTKLSSFNALAVCGSNGGTNYESAFDLARTKLQGQSGQNIIYFLTDGAPSVRQGTSMSGNDWEGGRQGAYEAMNRLRNSVSNLTVNAIYLRDNGGSSEMPPYDTRGLLEQLVGDSSRVREVSQASSLADAIVSFETPTPQGLSTSSFRAEYVIGSSVRATPSIKSFSQSGNNTYRYELEPVQIDCRSSSQSRIVFSGTTTSGETVRSEVIVSCTSSQS